LPFTSFKLPFMSIMIQSLLNLYGQFSRRPTKWTRWKHFDLICVYRGQLKICFEHQIVTCNEQVVILVYPETTFRGQSVTPVTDASVHHFIPSPPIDEKLGFKLAKRKHGFLHKTPSDWKAFRVDTDRIIRSPKKLGKTRLQTTNESLVTLILLNVLSEHHNPTLQGPHKHAMEELVNFLENNTDQNITLAEMADYISLSVSHFRKLFLETYGLTPGAFFKRLQMQQARRELKETLGPIKKIANQTGYEDVSHFHRAFKSYFGQSPGAYRRESKPII